MIQHSANLLNQLNTSKTGRECTGRERVGFAFVSLLCLETSSEFKITFRKKHAEENQLELLNGVLGTLANLCLFDSVGFITDERFQLLMMPVVDQVGPSRACWFDH
jgi:hypothetical protein